MQLNGVDLDLLQDATDMIREQREAGTVTIRTLHRWDDGFGVDGYAKEVEQGGKVTARTFTFRTDWPPEIGGRGQRSLSRRGPPWCARWLYRYDLHHQVSQPGCHYRRTGQAHLLREVFPNRYQKTPASGNVSRRV